MANNTVGGECQGDRGDDNTAGQQTKQPPAKAPQQGGGGYVNDEKHVI